MTDPYLKTVLENRAKATFAQLYLDQATSPELGAAINDAIAGLYAGRQPLRMSRRPSLTPPRRSDPSAPRSRIKWAGLMPAHSLPGATA